MNSIAVSDSLSNRPEHIEELAKLIGKGKKRDLFALVYSSQKRSWSVAELADKLCVTPKRASTLAVTLYTGGALHQDKAKNNRVTYRKVAAHQTIKDRVLKLNGDRHAIESLPTKRRPVVLSSLFVPVRDSASVSNLVVSPVLRSGAVARVAFLMASPANAGAINVGMDFREAERAVRSSVGRDKLQLRAFPAADLNALLDALNEYRPDVIQFSGHGAANLILLDGSEVRSTSGVTLDFSVTRSILQATDTPPKCLVLTACQTAHGASILLDTVPIIIGMSGDISDFAATYFCRRFYGAIAAGQSVAAAFNQAKASLTAERLPDANLPTLLTATGSNASDLILVR